VAYHPRHRGQEQRLAESLAMPATIAALATPAGSGGIAIVRISGPDVPAIAQALLGRLPPPRAATATTFRRTDGVEIDSGLAIYFPAPHSFTGEHVLELHAHGAPVVVDMLLQQLTDLGARLARPGEFSERAFLNDKLDLAQAEAIADLISAGSEAAARSALRSLRGEFSRRVRTIAEATTRLRMYVEAAIDFPEEDVDFLADETVSTELAALMQSLQSLLGEAQQGFLLQAGMTLVLAGAPNAGKSSLLNVLAREDAAIVSPTPGTTRDIVRARIDFDGMPVHVLDTAGLRVSQDPIEQEGVARARAAMTQADRVLLLIDDTAADTDAVEFLRGQVSRGANTTLIYSKIDLTGRAPGMAEGGDAVAISAKTGAGLDVLRTHLKQCMGFMPVGEGGFIARRRHLDALRRAAGHLVEGRRQLSEHRAGELLAEELRRAHQALGEITGEVTSDDLLGRIFSNFCIGK
jgi:tRNA modification GTPase